MRFCGHCGGALVERYVEVEERHRLVCDACTLITYVNPKPVVGTLPIWSGRVYLVRRNIEPALGAWTNPAGFLEVDETAEEGALRETREETNLDVEITGLLNVYSRPIAHVVVIVYLARVTGGEPRIQPETQEIAAFAPEAIPWDDLAFSTTHWALRDWLALRARTHNEV